MAGSSLNMVFILAMDDSEYKGLHQISLSLYQYLCRCVVGTEDTVKIKRIRNTLIDNSASAYHMPFITSGSFGEGLEMNGSDVDYMFVFSDVAVVEDITEIQSYHARALIFRLSQTTVKLRTIGCSDDFYLDLCEAIGNDLYLSNDRFKKQFIFVLQFLGAKENYKLHGPCLSDENDLYDYAACFHSKTWVRQANPWMSRSNNTWPSAEVKQQIIEHGVLFVPIAVKGSPNENIEWRISFSVGEKLLIYSFAHTQLLCYALMKVVLKDIINKDPECEGLLCSYFIKNIIFWLSEELPISIWRPNNLVPCFIRCLERLTYCVEYSVCFHFFIPENNMFENRIEGEKRDILLDKLRKLQILQWQCILLSPQLEKFSNYDFQFEANLLDFSFEQIVNSRVILSSWFLNSYSIINLIELIQSYKSSFIRTSVKRLMSQIHCSKAQYVQLCSTYSNKKLYRQYTRCRCYLMLNLHHDAVSRWLMLSSMFYKMKQYKTALDVLVYALQKCTSEKVILGTQLSELKRELLKSEIITSMGIQKAIAIFYLDRIHFEINSSLIPNELKTENEVKYHKVSPVLYGHFLSFLCHYYLRNIGQCKDLIRYIIQNIFHSYFINHNIHKAAALNCFGIAFQFIGDFESARKAFLYAIQYDTKFNNALQNLSIIDMTCSRQ